MEGEPRNEGKGHQRSISSPVSSPEFEFNFNHSSIQRTQLLSADELFADGILLPLQFLSREVNDQKLQIKKPISDPSPLAISSTSISTSKRWTDMFRLGSGDREKQKEENSNDTKKKKKTSNSTGVTVTPEQININIWPFLRSRSAGSRSKSKTMTGRKVSSTPCSRSNSGGSAVGRRWPGSPGRGGISSGGVHVGRSSPVWQVKKKSSNSITSDGWKKTVAAGGSVNGGGVKVLNLDVNGCVGSRQQMSCRGESRDKVSTSDRSVDGGSHSFGLKTLFFSRKVN